MVGCQRRLLGQNHFGSRRLSSHEYFLQRRFRYSNILLQPTHRSDLQDERRECRYRHRRRYTSSSLRNARCNWRTRPFNQRWEKQIVNDQVSLAEERHPRTGVGIANHGKTLYLIVVDGRQPGYSAGASLNDLATIFQALNCSDAIALDGGGSSTMIIREYTPDESASFPLLNKPSDSTGARKISNGILIIETNHNTSTIKPYIIDFDLS